MKRHSFCLLIAGLLIGACASLPAEAETVTATWTNPTTNTDDSVIPATGEGSLASARIAWGTCVGGAFGVEAGFITRPMPVSSVTINLQPAVWCLRVTVTNTYGETSLPSNVVSRTVAPPRPRAPTNLAVAP